MRHELKYKINYSDYLALKSRLCSVMKSDSHAINGKYLIRSIYFDNYNDKALREKTNGVQKREKFRIRWYNDDFSFITLEKKMKFNNLCSKFDATITYEQLTAILNGECDFMAFDENPLIREFYYKMKSQCLKPRVVVSYTREPFVFDAGNVRVTFDSNIKTSLFSKALLDNEYGVKASDDIILEVKYDAFLPEIIAFLLQVEGVRQGAFSKYGVCRRFG